MDELDLPRRPGKYENCTVIEDEIYDTRRWSIEHALIFQLPDQPEDEAWSVCYSHGATEMQEQGPWDDEEEVEATLMKLVEKTVNVWETK